MSKTALSLLIVSLFAINSFADEAHKSTLNDQSSVQVTVYNSNLALIKDTRNVKLSAGEGELRFMDVAALIMPETVLIKSLNDPNALNILEQNYEYDLISPERLMDKYVGKKIKLLDINEFQGKKETIEATLLSNNQGEVYQIGNDIYLGHPGYKILPEIPENLISKPTLTWHFDNASKKEHQLEVSYLTHNLNWHADYVLAVNADDTLSDLSGWVTLDNKSGATYKNAKLKLVAGEVNRANTGGGYAVLAKAGRALDMMETKAQFVEQSFFEYHIYDLQRPTTIKDNQTKQVNLLEANKVKVNKEFIVHGNQYWYTGQYSDQDLKTPVEVKINFKNSKENNLGMPLPAGIMRLYKADSAGSLQFIGEDNIKHTPKDEEVKLKIGEAFDIVAERVQTDFKVLSTWKKYESAWEITLRNHKDVPVKIVLLEPMMSDWEIVETSHKHTKADAFTARFDVDVPKDGEVKVKYRVRVKY